MNSTKKIIAALGVAIVLAACVLGVSLVKSGVGLKGESNTTSKPLYTLLSTTQPATLAETESWVDLDQMASDLATATDTSAVSDTTTMPLVSYSAQPQTTIVYVYVSEVYNTTTAPQTTQEDIVDIDLQEYKYTLNKDTKKITLDKYLGSESTVWIPEEIAGYKVATIGNKCFEGQKITGVCIRENIESIGNSAFQNCKNLKTVTFLGLPSKITVGDSAFKGCTSLKNINLPASKAIGDFAFDGCTALENLVLQEGTEEIGEYCFTNCTSLLKIEIPMSVGTIGQGAFLNHNDELVIRCYAGSHADEIRRKYAIKAEYIDYTE